ncbi:hypothetical protein [Cerasicoccus frondis]|uniref:hypothetical protein n=1 Tax=Cerasicoccus frondis TaxID=490090 RepID=UPI002852BB9E|nr:hypothetical protein [Cerasicoccus frondis]
MKTRQILTALALLTPLAAIACGPWLPVPYVVRNDSVFFSAPQVGFLQELEQVLPVEPTFTAVLVEDQSPNATEALLVTLRNEDIPENERTQILNAYQRYRQLLNDAKTYHDTSPYRSYRAAQQTQEMVIARLRNEHPPTSLPAEFQRYLAGAREYYLGNIDQARQHWQAVLDLPQAKRQHQSVRAAFMLAKTSPDKASIAAFQHVRDLAKQGFDDPDGLAAASYGREAQIALRQENFQRAIKLYLLQWRTGYWNAGLSLQRTAGYTWQIESAERFAQLLKDEQVRAVLTAHLLTSYDTSETKDRRERFLTALPSPKEITVNEAGRFALLEYQQNNISATRHWLAYATPDDALALWVRSKMLLRDGHIDEGRTLLVELLRQSNQETPDWDRLDTRHAWGELGLLYLRKQNYSQAANSFANAQSWLDLAYVMERVMTTEELLEWSLFAPGIPVEQNFWISDPRQLIARRLMREARFKDALAYFSGELRSQADAYIAAMQTASDDQQPPQTRAKHYWIAARIIRDYGMELLGTELDPDFAWSDGLHTWPHSISERRDQRDMKGYAVNVPSYEEIDRVDRSAARPNQRFHYRYRAAQLAELAAGLLPNNDENAARIYCIAGSWIKNRDPYAADRFYKQLVVRCPETPLGQIAAKRHWFPDQADIPGEPFES